MPGKSIHKIIFGGALAGVALGNLAFGWFRSFDWLHKNAPGAWGVIVTPEFQYTLIAIALAMCGAGLWEWWKHRRSDAEAQSQPQVSATARAHSTAIAVGGSVGAGASIHLGNHYEGVRPPKPQIILEWHAEAQFSRFILANRGDADATEVQLSNLVSKDRYFHWRMVDRIRSGKDAEIEIWTIEGHDAGHTEGVHTLVPLRPELGRCKCDLDWLTSDSPESSYFEGEVTITGYGDDGQPLVPAIFDIMYNKISREVSVLPKRQQVQSDQ